MNLKDKLTSNENSTVTTAKSSKEQDLIQKQSELIQKLSSENSTLKSELQKKSETIVSLNEKIERLSQSDLILVQNEKLQSENQRLQRDGERVEKLAIAVKQREQDLQTSQAELNHIIEVRATEMIRSKQRAIETTYKKMMKDLFLELKLKRAGIQTLLVGSLLYGILTTIFTAVKSVRIGNDFIGLTVILINLIQEAWLKTLYFSSLAWSVKQNISYEYLDVGVAGVLTGLAFTGSMLLFYGLPLAFLGFIGWSYYSRFKDTTSLAIALITMAVIVWFADDMILIPWNLILIWLSIQVIYVLIRTVVMRYNENR